MLVNLRDLKPNPARDFKVDPLDPDTVETLRQSIKEDGFWGGVVARKIKGGDIQVAAGWHRVKAAIKAGIDRADIFVATDMDDAGLIRVYARENATQRGNSGTAQVGTVAAAVRYLAKLIMTGTLRHVSPFGETSTKSEEVLRGQLASDKGLGEPIIVEFFQERIPGINHGTVRQQLGILKSSGDYARIIGDVSAEIERENKEAIKALEKAERERIAAEQAAKEAEQVRKEAAAKAKAAKEEAERKRAIEAEQRAEAMAKLAEKRRKEAQEEAAKFDALRTTVDTARKASNRVNGAEIFFDFEGVAKHLTQANHIETFRKIVVAPGIRPYLPVKRQAALAADLVRQAKSKNAELTSSFIRDNVGNMVHAITVENKRIAKEEAERLERQNWEIQARTYQHEFSRRAGDMLKAAMQLAKHDKDRPEGVTLHLTAEFRDSIKRAKDAIQLIETKLL
jgi:hypothetical protein